MKQYNFTSLFCKRSETDIRKYIVSVIETDLGATIVKRYGKVGGKEILNETYISTGKNIGKSNETTAYKQAISIAKADIDKKKQDGYIEITEPFSTLDQLSVLPITPLGKFDNLLPMKAVPFIRGRNTYPLIGQRKINGMRSTLRWETITIGTGIFTETQEKAVFRAKHGIEYYMPHITDKLKKEDFYLEDGTELVYDGELYIHGRPLNYIKASCPTVLPNGLPTKSKHDYNLVSFIMFDLSIPEILQEDRLELLRQQNIDRLSSIKILIPVTLTSDDEVFYYRDKFIEAGYEGIIIREPNAEYQFGKKNIIMQKLKKETYTTCKLIDIVEKANSSNRVNIVYVLKNDLNDKVFECTPLGNNTDKLEILANKAKYIGKMCEVKYYERSGENNLPFHANVTRIL